MRQAHKKIIVSGEKQTNNFQSLFGVAVTTIRELSLLEIFKLVLTSLFFQDFPKAQIPKPASGR